MKTEKTLNTQKLVLLALLSAIVIVLQLLAIYTRPLFPAFAISLVLMPIVVGAALIGVEAGAWLGLVFGLAVLLSGDAAAFMTIDPFGTIVVVLAKGVLAGLFSALVYKLLAGKNKTWAAIVAAVVCPLVNTGVFVLGVYLFFLPTVSAWGLTAGFENVTTFIFIGMIGINFLVEMTINLVLCPSIIRLVHYGQERRAA